MANELESVKPEKVTMMIHGKEREIKFNFSAWADIEKEYGGFENFEKAITDDLRKRPFETLPHLLYIALRDKEGVTEKDILDDYGIEDIEYISDIFNKALYGALPADDGKNLKVEAE